MYVIMYHVSYFKIWTWTEYKRNSYLQFDLILPNSIFIRLYLKILVIKFVFINESIFKTWHGSIQTKFISILPSSNYGPCTAAPINSLPYYLSSTTNSIISWARKVEVRLCNSNVRLEKEGNKNVNDYPIYQIK